MPWFPLCSMVTTFPIPSVSSSCSLSPWLSGLSLFFAECPFLHASFGPQPDWCAEDSTLLPGAAALQDLLARAPQHWTRWCNQTSLFLLCFSENAMRKAGVAHSKSSNDTESHVPEGQAPGKTLAGGAPLPERLGRESVTDSGTPLWGS